MGDISIKPSQKPNMLEQILDMFYPDQTQPRSNFKKLKFYSPPQKGAVLSVSPQSSL